MHSAPHDQFRVLLVDDEEHALTMTKMALESEGVCAADVCADSRQALEMLDARSYHAAVIDLMMPHVSGDMLLADISQRHPEVACIIVTAVNDLETAVCCMKRGAVDYLVKPVGRENLIAAMRRIREKAELLAENQRLRGRLLDYRDERPDAFAPIVTASSRMKGIFSYIEAIAESSWPVLITGETGAGKELIARSIHELSGRDGEMVCVNVAGLDDQLVADTLFGHEPGAFTGASTRREGLLARAAGGTLFLDEIGDLGAESQVKLLRVLQERAWYPLGSDRPVPTDARIIAATHRDIDNEQQRNAFRRDLYYRLRTHRIDLPPLRKRLEDLPLLVEHFLETISAEMGKSKPRVPAELYTLLRQYDFPGNVRELESLIADALSRHESGVLSTRSFADVILGDRAPAARVTDAEDRAGEGVAFHDTLPRLREIEPILIAEALRRADNNQSLAAQMLGVSRQTLNSRIVKMRDR
jgi:DNA-binding NtrC family response regulator